MNLYLLFDKKNWKKLLFVSKINKNNDNFEKQYIKSKNDQDVNIYGFYHAYCMVDNWEKLVFEQVNHIQESGLYSRITKLYCGALIKKGDIETLKKLGGNKFEILFTSEDRTLFEFPTLIEMQKRCLQETFLGFYFHTKGISWIKTPQVYNVGNTWRLMNEFFIFDKYKLAIHSLNEGFDIYGTNYQEIFNDQFRIIGGNFFWFRSDYVKNIPELKVHKENRNLSETWICSNTHNVYDPFSFSGNTRYDSIPSELYIQSGSKAKRIFLSIKIYFSRFNYLFKRLFNLKVNIINPAGTIK